MNSVMSVADLRSRIESDVPLQIVDVRSPSEYNSGHVPGAVNIPIEQLDSRFPDLSKGEVALLCHSGNRADMACNLIRHLHDGLIVVEGGTEAWIRAGLPIVRSTANRWSIERQVRLIAGALILTGSALALTIDAAWTYLPLLIGAGLTFAGLTNQCGMAMVLAKLPWNRAASCEAVQLEVAR